MNAPVEIHLQQDGILITTSATRTDESGAEVIGKPESVFRKVGQYWLVGAVDWDLYPYEVMIHVVKRFNAERQAG